MCNITITTNNSIDYTTISNDFLDNYMPLAKGEYVKIYLYLLRAMSAPNMEISVSSIADKFDYVEKDVIRALTYWSNEGLLKIGYNDANEINMITFANANSTKVRQVIADIPTIATNVSEEPTVEKEEKTPNYTPSQIAAFKDADEDFKLLLHMINGYWGAPLKTNIIKEITYFYDSEQGLGFSTDLIEYLFEYCIEIGKKDIKYIRNTAINWDKNGITTKEEAKTHERSPFIFKIRKVCGLGTSGAPTPTELEHYNRWKTEFGFSNDTILEACNEAVLRSNRPTLKYLDGILTNWHKFGKDAPAKSQAITYTSKVKTSSIKNFEERDYNFDELERKLAAL